MEWIIAISGCVMLLLIAPFISMYARRRWLTGQGGLFDCAYKDQSQDWSLGFARYRGDNLEWFKAFALTLKPDQVIRRGFNDYVEQREAYPAELDTLFFGSRIMVVRSRQGVGECLLAMDPQYAMGLMSWLESAPPGSHVLPGSADSPL